MIKCQLCTGRKSKRDTAKKTRTFLVLVSVCFSLHLWFWHYSVNNTSKTIRRKCSTNIHALINNASPFTYTHTHLYVPTIHCGESALWEKCVRPSWSLWGTYTHTSRWYIVGKVQCGENACVLVGRCGERTPTHTCTHFGNVINLHSAVVVNASNALTFYHAMLCKRGFSRRTVCPSVCPCVCHVRTFCQNE